MAVTMTHWTFQSYNLILKVVFIFQRFLFITVPTLYPRICTLSFLQDVEEESMGLKYSTTSSTFISAKETTSFSYLKVYLTLISFRCQVHTRRLLPQPQLPKGIFPNVQLPKSVCTAALGPLPHPSRSTRPPMQPAALLRSRKSPLGKCLWKNT